MGKIYKELKESETETTINVLYSEKKFIIYTNKVDLQRQLYKILGEPQKEYVKGKSIVGSCWEVPLSNASKINKIILKTNIYGI